MPAPSIQFGDLTGVSGSSESDVWAVGEVQGPPEPPFVLHYDGTSWTKIKNLVPYGNLHAVVSISANDAWIVGWSDHVITEHWDGSTWTLVPAPYIGSYDFVYAVDASSPTDVWLVGNYSDDQGFVHALTEHWDGSSWSLVPAATGSAIFYDVAAVAPGDAWAVGYTGGGTEFEPISEHWDGTTWTIVPMVDPPSGAFNEMTGVSAVASDDVWAVGYGGSNGDALIEHWDGTAWSRVRSPKPSEGEATPLFDVVASSASDAWAVGKVVQGVDYRFLTEHWDGLAWQLVPNPSGQRNGTLFSVSEISPTSVWAVGAAIASDGLSRPLTEVSGGCSVRSG